MASLVIVDGPAKGKLLALAQHRVVTVGRDDQCTFQVLDPLVSRQHMQIRFDEAAKRHLAADYRSANGVLINGKQVVGDVALSNNDLIQIGATKMMYTLEDFPDAQSAMAAVKKSDEWKRSTLVRD